jgi:simple sugar transport system permease protein
MSNSNSVATETEPVKRKSAGKQSVEPRDERLVAISVFTRFLQRPALGALLAAIVIFVIFAFSDSTSNHLWLSPVGLAAWSQTASFFGIMAVPVGLLMIAGEFDLSTGVMTGATAITMGVFVGILHWNAWAAALTTITIAIVVGLINGIVVTRTKLPSFIVTLATFFVVRGITIGGVLLINQGSTQISLSGSSYPGFDSLKKVFGGSFLTSTTIPNGVSSAVLWFLGVTIVGAWVLSRTRFGNWIFAAGGDPIASRSVGVPVARTKVLLFVASSVMAALVGIISFSESSSAVSEQGVGYEFYYIIAAVVGGCLLTGGYGSVVGSALGACIIGMAFQGVIYSGWDSSWDFTFLGVILFLAVIVNTLIYRRAQRARK